VISVDWMYAVFLSLWCHGNGIGADKIQEIHKPMNCDVGGETR